MLACSGGHSTVYLIHVRDASRVVARCLRSASNQMLLCSRVALDLQSNCTDGRYPPCASNHVYTVVRTATAVLVLRLLAAEILQATINYDCM